MPENHVVHLAVGTWSNINVMSFACLHESRRWVNLNEMSSGHATSHEPSYPSSGMFGSTFPSCHGPDIGVYPMQFGEDREIFFNLMSWLK